LLSQVKRKVRRVDLSVPLQPLGAFMTSQNRPKQSKAYLDSTFDCFGRFCFALKAHRCLLRSRKEKGGKSSLLPLKGGLRGKTFSLPPFHYCCEASNIAAYFVATKEKGGRSSLLPHFYYYCEASSDGLLGRCRIDQRDVRYYRDRPHIALIDYVKP
jgi:hypothetical protein